MVPDCIEPVFGKVGQDMLKSMPRKETWDVLQEHEAGSHTHNEPKDRRPEPPGVVDAFSLPGTAPRLAGKTRRHDVHASAPFRRWEGLNAIPDRRAIQRRRFHACHESGRRCGFPLNVTHGSYSVSEREIEGDVEPAVSGAH
jgi:hypothetical protein